MKNRVAFTTTVPVELILAAGRVPMDLNNTFVTSEKSMEMVEHAEIFGFPRNSCAWIKGLFSVVSTMEEYRDIGLFVAVTEGDCSNARVLTEIIEEQYGLNTYIFNYPFDRSPEKVTRELEKFAAFLGTDISEGEKVRKRLSSLRSKLRELDEMTNREPWRISGLENHLWLVSSSDFDGGIPTSTRSGSIVFFPRGNLYAVYQENEPDESPSWECHPYSISTPSLRRREDMSCTTRFSVNSRW